MNIQIDFVASFESFVLLCLVWLLSFDNIPEIISEVQVN